MTDDHGSLQQILAGMAGAEMRDADLVLMQLDPEPARLLELCAIPHLFDRELISAVDPLARPELIDTFLDEVLSLPSIRQIGDCFALHDIVRSQLFERWLQPVRRDEFAMASLRLAEHYEAARRGGGKPEAEANEPVVMFHRLGADLEAGFREFQALYRRYRDSARYSACEALVRLVAEYRPVLSDRQRAWLRFYEAEAARDGRDTARAVSLLTELTHRELEPALAIRAHVHLSAALRSLRRQDAAREQVCRALRLASANPEGGALLHLVHQELGLIARDEGDVEEGSRHLRRTVELGTIAEDRLVVAGAYNSLGTVLQKFDPQQAIAALESGAALLTDEADAVRRAQVLNNLGLAYANVGDWARSEQSYERSLEIKRASVDLYGQALTLLNIARVFRAAPAALCGAQCVDRIRSAVSDSARSWIRCRRGAGARAPAPSRRPDGAGAARSRYCRRTVPAGRPPRRDASAAAGVLLTSVLGRHA